MGLAAVKGTKEHRLTEKISKTRGVKQTSPFSELRRQRVIGINLI